MPKIKGLKHEKNIADLRLTDWLTGGEKLKWVCKNVSICGDGDVFCDWDRVNGGTHHKDYYNKSIWSKKLK